MTEFSLGRRVPNDFDHVVKYPMRAAISSTITTVEKKLLLPYWHKEHDQGSEGACFLSNTLIRMADGSNKSIDQIKNLDKVISAEGNPQLVLKTMVRLYDGPLYNIQLWGHNFFQCTEEHPILTKRGYIKANKIKNDDFVALPKFQYVNSKELQSDIDLKIDRVKFRGTKEGEIMAGNVLTKVTSVPKVIELNKGLGIILGLYAAEGGCSENKVTWTFNINEEFTLVEQLINLLNSELGIEARKQYRPNNTVNVIVYNKLWVHFFKTLVTGNVYSKSLSSLVTSGSKDFLEGIFTGWIEGDGCIDKSRNRIVGVSVSKNLAMDMFNIAQSLSLKPVISMQKASINKHAKNRRDRWSVEYRKEQIREKNTLGALTWSSEEDKKYVWRKVRNIKIKEYAGWVYNFEVDHDNSYIADGIGVHNCVGFGSSMMLSIINESQARAAVTKPYTHRYDPRWLWDQAKMIDEWPETNPGDNEGTSVRAACDVLRTQGHVLVYRGKNQLVNALEGISTNRWATTVDEIRTAIAFGLPLSIGVNWYSNFDSPVLKGKEYWIGEGNLGSIRGGHCLCLYGASDKRQAFILKNSWGQSYPLVWIPYTTVERLINEYGEFALVTDK